MSEPKFAYLRNVCTDDVIDEAILNLVKHPSLYEGQSDAQRLRSYIQENYALSEEELSATVADVDSEDHSHSKTNFFTLKNAHRSDRLRDHGCIDKQNQITEHGLWKLSILQERPSTNSKLSNSKPDLLGKEYFAIRKNIEFLQTYLHLGIVRLEDSDALLKRAMSNNICDEERSFLNNLYFGTDEVIV